MKLRILALLCAFGALTAIPARAQSNISAGIKGGVNFSDIAIDPDDEPGCCDRRTGFIGGLFMTMPFTPTFGVQPEFLYSQKGATFDFGDEGSADLKIDYFEIPVLMRADFSSAPNRGFVLFGPTFGFKTRAKQSAEFGGEDFEEDIKDDVETFDFGFAIAAGFQFGRGSLEARYTHGLTDADNDSEAEARHRVVSILAGFRF